MLRLLPGLALGAALALASSPAAADQKAGKGLGLAKKGDCEKAVPLLEDAELGRHRPATAVALADCYVREGELISASELYRAVAADKPVRGWTRDDYNAWKASSRKAEEVDARIPTIVFEVPDDYDGLEIEVDGRKITDPAQPLQVPSDTSIPIVARAKGRKDFTDKLVLNERERRTVVIKFEGGPGAPKAKPGAGAQAGKGASGAKTTPGQTWIGARYRGAVIPKFLFHTFADGARSVVAPGANVFLQLPANDAEILISLGYMSYNMIDTPFKPKGAPDTDWEFVSSTLQALVAAVDLRFSVPLDARGEWTLKIGGGVGVGWTFLGDIHRVQAFPADFKPGNPYTYLKCLGPNNPRGSFAYCNTLDKDANHYGSYAEPSWFNHGVRPLIYPWLVLPEVGFSWKATPRVSFDLGVGLSLTGLITDLGFRVAL